MESSSVESIPRERWRELLGGARNVRKIELRDHYGIDTHFTAWASGDLATVAASYQSWRDQFASGYVQAGRRLQRVRVVSEPLSDYQRMALTYSGITADLGEGLRWLPRRLVSAVPLPGNDCFVLDGQAVLFNVFDAAADDLVETQYSADPAVVKFCRDAFEAAWALATPHKDYHTQMIVT